MIDHENGRFFIRMEGGTAELLYKIKGNKMDVYHVFVPESGREKGAAAQLAEAAFEFAKRSGYTVIPTCPYIRDSFLQKHRQWQEIVD